MSKGIYEKEKKAYLVHIECPNCGFNETFEKSDAIVTKETSYKDTDYMRSVFYCNNCGFRIYWRNTYEKVKKCQKK